MNKKWYLSKTVWVNVVAIIVLAFNDQFGIKISAEVQGMILGLINLGLRKITKTAITW